MGRGGIRRRRREGNFILGEGVGVAYPLLLLTDALSSTLQYPTRV